MYCVKYHTQPHIMFCLYFSLDYVINSFCNNLYPMWILHISHFKWSRIYGYSHTSSCFKFNYTTSPLRFLLAYSIVYPFLVLHYKCSSCHPAIKYYYKYTFMLCIARLNTLYANLFINISTKNAQKLILYNTGKQTG
jgi:hypothetical protein